MFRAGSDAVFSVISGESIVTVTSSTSSESFVLSTVRNAFIVLQFEAEVASASTFSVVSINVPMSVHGASFTVNTIISGKARDAITSSSRGESLVLATIWDTFVINHLESEVANAGTFTVVSVDIPMSVFWAFLTVLSVVSSESVFAVASSSGSNSFVLSTMSASVSVMGIMRFVIVDWVDVNFFLLAFSIDSFVSVLAFTSIRSVNFVFTASWLAGVGFQVPNFIVVTFASFGLAAVSAVRWASSAVSSESNISLLAFTVVSDKFFMFATLVVMSYCNY